MFQLLFGPESANFLGALGPLVTFVISILHIAVLKEKLPRDGGRNFAHDGALSAGKPRGTGLIFILVFDVAVLIYAPFHLEYVIYLVLITIEMITGFLDDASKIPWTGVKKGIMDFGVALICAVNYLWFNENTFVLAFFKTTVTLPVWLYGILIVALVWGAINVTNCADGVDGLSSTLALVSLGCIYLVGDKLQMMGDFKSLILMFGACLLAYLWFNSTPSILMMGDAGSRAMGAFLAIAVLKSGDPILFIPLALVLILDGGLGLLKISLIRLTKNRNVMNKIRTPLHDHVRKLMGWSNTQTVYRFAIIQMIIGAMVVLFLY